MDALTETAGFVGDGLRGEGNARAVEREDERLAFGDDDGAPEVGELDGLAGLDRAAKGLAFGLGVGADDVPVGEAEAETGPLQIGRGNDVAGEHVAAENGKLDHRLDAAGQANKSRRDARRRDLEHGGEAAGGGVELGGGEVENWDGTEREGGHGDRGQLDIAVLGGAGLGEGGAERGEQVVLGKDTAGAFQDGAVAGAGRTPINGEHMCDGDELGSFDGDAVAGCGRGAERTVVGAVEQVREVDDGAVERGVGLERRRAGEGGDEREGAEGPEHWSHRRFVMVCCIWSVAVMTLLFIS